MADDGQVVVLVLVDARQPLRPFDLLDLGVDADVGELGRDDLSALTGIGRRRQDEAELERRRHARLLEQRLRLRRVMRVEAGEVDIAGIVRGQMAADRRAEAVHRPVDDRLAVDRIGDRLPHPDIVERLLLVVDRKDRLALGAADQHLETRIALELAKAPVRSKVGHDVDVAGKHRRDFRRRIGDEAEGRMLERDLRRRRDSRPTCRG